MELSIKAMTSNQLYFFLFKLIGLTSEPNPLSLSALLFVVVTLLSNHRNQYDLIAFDVKLRSHAQAE